MGKLHDYLQKQLKTEHRQDAEDCLKIYNKLFQIHDGHIWESNWNPLVSVTSKDYPNTKRIYKPTSIGYIFLDGLNKN